MFLLRPEHMEAFAEGCRQTFEDRMTADIAARFPAKFEELGEDVVREWIADGISRVGEYEIHTLPDVARFIRFMFSMGRDFDTAWRTRWAGPILEDTEAPAAKRLDQIREEARRRRADERAS